MDFDIVLVIALVIAVVVFLQLRSVLGKRTGFERPPFDPYSRQSENAEEKETDTVVALPKPEAKAADDFSDIDKIAPEDSDLNKGLRAIRKEDATFSPNSFLDGARVAYEMVVTAFAKADKNTLKSLLSDDVFAGFSSAIDERDKKVETVKFTFVGIDKIEIIDASCEADIAQLTIRVESEIISATYDDSQKLIDGDPQTIAEIKDIWTFARNVKSRDPNWKIIGTEDGE